MAEQEPIKDFTEMGAALRRKEEVQNARPGIYDELAEAFDRGKKPYTGWVWDCLKKHVKGDPADQDVLDIACGTGLSTRGLRLDGFTKTVGVDLDPKMLAIARRNAPEIPYYEGSAAKLPFPDESFDAVTIYWAFQNFGEDEASMKEIRRVLRPGGICMVIAGTIEGFSREGRGIIRKYMVAPETPPPGATSGGRSSLELLRDKYHFRNVTTYTESKILTFTADEAFHAFDASTQRNFVPKENVKKLNDELELFCKRLAKEDEQKGGPGLLYRPLTMIVDIAVK
ncbi:MAG: methyltransferase domain-containing protein [Minisyncoccia bacterium]